MQVRRRTAFVVDSPLSSSSSSSDSAEDDSSVEKLSADFCRFSLTPVVAAPSVASQDGEDRPSSAVDVPHSSDDNTVDVPHSSDDSTVDVPHSSGGDDGSDDDDKDKREEAAATTESPSSDVAVIGRPMVVGRKRERQSQRLRRLLDDYRQVDGVLNGSHRIALWLFFRLLGLTYLIALGGLWYQLDGLFGSDGVAPVRSLLAADAQLPSSSSSSSLVWSPLLAVLRWTSGAVSVDVVLHVLCAAGCGGAALLLCRGRASGSGWLLAGLWLVHLSLHSVGQGLLSTPWDLLLCELGFVAVWLSAGEPSRALVALCHWLAFRFVLEPAVARLSDAAWTEQLVGSRLLVQAQPLPTPLSFYLYHCPPLCHQLASMLLLLAELAAPFLLLGPRSLRIAGALLLLPLQLATALTGSRGFFDLLVVALLLLVLDDRFFVECLPRLAAPFLRPPRPTHRQPPPRRRRRPTTIAAAVLRLLSVAVAALLLAASVQPFLHSVVGKSGPAPLRRLHELAARLRLSNDYSGSPHLLLPPLRSELLLSGSPDGVLWSPVALPYRPGAALDRPPPFALFYLPRLDWAWSQLAASSSWQQQQQQQPWLATFLVRIMRHSPAVRRLVDDGGVFADRPPAFVRLVKYAYQFEQPSASNWWRSERVGDFVAVVSLANVSSLTVPV